MLQQFAVSPHRPETPCALVVDVGSSSVRAAVYDGRGHLVPGSVTKEPYDFHTTVDGGVEADPGETVDRLVRVVATTLAAVGELAGEIRAVGMSTYWHNVLGTDAAGEPLTPVYTWADNRAAAAAVELARELDPVDVHRRTGCVLHPSFLPAKLRWLSRRDPAAFNRVSRWVSIGEWLLWRLTGQLVCSISMASGSGLFNHQIADWDDAILAAVGVRRDQLAPIARDQGQLPSPDAIAAPDPGWASTVSPPMLLQPRGVWRAGPHADALAVLLSAPWFAALGDGACANAGSGGIGRGRVALSLGTSLALRVMVAGEALAPPPGLWVYRLTRQEWLVGGADSNGGNVHAWLRQTLNLGPGNEDPPFGLPDGHGLTVLPFLAGERSPNWNPNARAAIIGLTWHSRPADILQASLEAVAYRCAAIYDRLKPFVNADHIVVASGAAIAQSAVWGQLLADTFGETVVESAETEASSRGAALVALRSIGAIDNLAEFDPPINRRWEPDSARHAIYQAAATRQQDYYHRVLNTMQS